MTDQLIAWLLSIYFLLFALLWLGVCRAIAAREWSVLARHFLALSKPQGKTLWMQSALLGNIRYNSVLNCVICESGLYLRPILPFRYFHPPLLIPWCAFTKIEATKILWVWQFKTQINMPDGKCIALVVARPLGQVLQNRASNPDSLR